MHLKNYVLTREIWHINIFRLHSYYLTHFTVFCSSQTTHSLVTKLHIVSLFLPLLTAFLLISFLFPLMTISFPNPSSNANSMKTFLVPPNIKSFLSPLMSSISALKCHTLYLSYLYSCLSFLYIWALKAESMSVTLRIPSCSNKYNQVQKYFDATWLISIVMLFLFLLPLCI